MNKIGIDKDGWVVSGPAESVYPPEGGTEKTKDELTVEEGKTWEDVEPRDPATNEEAWKVVDGELQLQETGYTAPPTAEERIDELEKATGTGQPSEQGISQRLDDIESRLENLESG